MSEQRGSGGPEKGEVGLFFIETK
jgi:hypothetical protein